MSWVSGPSARIGQGCIQCGTGCLRAPSPLRCTRHRYADVDRAVSDVDKEQRRSAAHISRSECTPAAVRPDPGGQGVPLLASCCLGVPLFRNGIQLQIHCAKRRASFCATVAVGTLRVDRARRAPMTCSQIQITRVTTVAAHAVTVAHRPRDRSGATLCSARRTAAVAPRTLLHAPNAIDCEGSAAAALV